MSRYQHGQCGDAHFHSEQALEPDLQPRFIAPMDFDGAAMGLQRSPDWGCDGATDGAADGAADGAMLAKDDILSWYMYMRH